MRQMYRITERYREAIESIGTLYRSRRADGKLVGTIEDVLQSFLHMTCNRLFKSDGRAHEFMIHDLLRRHYLAEINRRRHQAGKHGVIATE